MIYHYTESCHGKGQSDGIVVGLKKRLENLVLGVKAINENYKVYKVGPQTNQK